MKEEFTVMQIIRIPPTGKLVVEADGHRFHNLDEVTHRLTRQRILAAIGELVSFAGNYTVLVDAGLAPPIQPPPGSPDAPAEPDLAEQRARFLESLERERDALKQRVSGHTAPLLPLPGQRPVQEPPRPLEAAAVTVAAPASPLSIVEQIDAVLQKHLATDPKLARQDIHLKQSGDGLRILVDNHVYERPADVPDKRLQLAIKMALKEWELRK